MKNKKRLIILVTIILLLVPAFLFLVPVKQGRTFVQEVKYRKLLAGAVQPNNYDKMKISYTTITERKTGTPSFNTESGQSVDDGSILSDTEGNDVSELDNYIRTYDNLIYRIEVGVEKNPYTTTESESLHGGVIKISITAPKNEDGHPWVVIRKENWMSNLKRSKDFTTLTAEYIIPSDETIVGGTQELTIRFHTQGYIGEIPEDMKPIIKVWMEGNKPDNDTSNVESQKVEDNNSLYITGKQKLTMEYKEGIINRKSTLNGVTGSYINFGTLIKFTGGTMKGLDYPYNGVKSKIRLEYYYDNLDDNDGWIKLDRENEADREILDGIQLVAYGRPYEATPGFWPSENSNTFKSSNEYYGAAAELDGYLEDSPYKYESGVLSASYDNDILSFENHDNYFNGYRESGWEHFISNGFELFIPYYDETGNYAYQVKLVDYELEGINYKNESAIFTPNKTLTIGLINQLSGNISNSLYYIYENYTDEELTTAVMNGYAKGHHSLMYAADGPYEGGEDRLIVWDSAILEPQKINENKFKYDSGEDTPNLSIKYGIYKYNSGTLTNDDVINAAVYDDFDWYDSFEEAHNIGKISGVFIDDPDYRGFGTRADYYFKLDAIPDINNTRKTAMIKHSIRLYQDTERTNFTSSGYNQVYIKTTVDDSGNPVSHGTPYNIGQTMIAAPLSLSLYLQSRDLNNQIKSTFNVQEKYVSFSLEPRYNIGVPEEIISDFNIEISLDNRYITYREGSSNYEPTVTTSYNSQKLTWRFTQTNVKDLPLLTFQVEISPYVTNNSRTQPSAYSRSPAYPNDYGYTNHGISFINLSGSSMRENLNKDYFDKAEDFEITNYIYNISDEELNNIKSIEILPKNGDEKGSNFTGDYTIQILSIGENQKVYYTTSSIDNIPKDEDGNYTIKNIDVATNTNWIEVNVDDIIPANATAIATTTPNLEVMKDVSFKYKLIPNGNKIGDIYYFQSYASSDNLLNTIKTELTKAQIVERKISGRVFDDLNRNDIFNSSDGKEKDYVVELLNEEGTKISETITDNNGYYEFALADKGKYYIRFANLPNGYELTPKGTTVNHNKINPNMESDLIDHTITAHSAIEMIDNINLGMRKKSATLTVKYLDKNNDNDLADPVIRTVYYTDTYETKGLTNIPENYSFLENAGDPVTEIVNKDNIEVIYYYDFTPATVTARHYLDGTTTKIHEDVVQNKKFTQEYETSHLNLDDYDYLRTDGDAEEGTINKTSIVVNYYYKYKVGTVTTHHYLYDNGDTTTKLAPDVSKKWNYTETYTTSVSDEVPQNYEFYKKSDNYTAIMSASTVEVNYYYRMKDSNLTTSITKTGDEEITSKDAEVNYTITYNAMVKDYIGNGTITIVDTLPYKIDVDNSNLDGGTYNENNKTITWTESWNNIDTYSSSNNEVTKEITKNIKLVYEGIVGRDRIMTNTTKGTITLSNNTRDAQAQTSTSIKIKGKIKVIYIDVDTEEELFDSVEEEDLVGETFISESHEKDGYKIVTKPDSETFEFEEDEQLITYGYEHIKYEVKGVVVGGGGSITGDEDVYWGEDSTEGNIKITAEPGFIIESVIVNGEEIDIEPGQEEMVLGQFLQVLENKNIEVTFIKKPTENPNTKGFIGILALIVSFIVLGLLFIKRKTFRRNRYVQ